MNALSRCSDDENPPPPPPSLSFSIVFHGTLFIVGLLPANCAVSSKGRNNFAQVQPPGINIIYLPFADDIRSPETDAGFLGPPPYPAAEEEQIAAAGNLLKKLYLNDFQPGTVPNPHLQRHYQVRTSLTLTSLGIGRHSALTCTVLPAF